MIRIIKYLISSAVFLLIIANFLPAEAAAENTQTAAALNTEQEVAKKLPAASAGNDFATLIPFGSEFFSTAEQKRISVPMQYRIGQKDKISLVWGGTVNTRHELTVDGDGRINIPRIGSVFVAGMTFEEMSKQITKKLEEAKVAPADISMTALKTMPIFIRGEVRRPGPHTVGTSSTVTEALIFAGGPNENGSIRNVQVRRKGITVASFDLYDLLLNGFKAKDITLMAGDEVFVFVKGPAVGITGSISRPAIYELNDRLDLENLIGLAGGLLPAKEALRMQVERVTGKERQVIYDVSQQDINLKKSVPPLLQDKDLVRISPLAERYAVTHQNSNVLTPVKDEIKSQLSLPEKTTSSGGVEELKPQQATDLNGQNIPAGDTAKYVTLSGEFKLPGRYPISKGEKLSSVIKRAGGYTNNAYLRGAYFTRESVRQIQQQNLDDMAARLQKQLLPTGSVTVSNQTNAAKIKAIQTETELKERFIEHMKSLQATGRLTVIVTHLRLLKGSERDIEMEAGDSLHLPQNPNVVNVMGAVLSEGPRLYNEKWAYWEYISAAGGYAKHADEPDIFVIKADGSTHKLFRGLIEWSNRNERWEITAFGEKVKQIESGDVIVVPEKLNHISWLKQSRDITRLLMNTAGLTGRVLRLW